MTERTDLSQPFVPIPIANHPQQKLFDKHIPKIEFNQSTQQFIICIRCFQGSRVNRQEEALREAVEQYNEEKGPFHLRYESIDCLCIRNNFECGISRGEGGRAHDYKRKGCLHPKMSKRWNASSQLISYLMGCHIHFMPCQVVLHQILYSFLASVIFTSTHTPRGYT